MKLLLIEFNDTYFRNLAAQLLRDNVQIAYISTLFPELYQKDTIFKKTILLDEKNFHLSDKIRNLNLHNPDSLSKETLIEYLELESLYLSITDRLSFYPKTVIERKKRYNEVLLYWKSFLESQKITHVFFPRVPHLGYGNVIYYIAKKLGIKVLLLRETIFDDKSLLTEGYNDFKKVPISYLKNETVISLKKKLLSLSDSTLEKQSNLMKWNATDNATALSKNSSILLGFINSTTITGVAEMIQNPFKRFIGTPVFMEPPTSWLHYYWMIFLYFLRYQKSLARYKKLAQSVNLKKKYVYLALHYQPERTTMPEGDVFENQLLMIDIISKSLPKGWLLYVKEHPFQYTRTDIRKMNFRNPSYYDKMLQYSNLKLVSWDTNSRDLILNCQAAVTLTGSTGWESLLAHKPVLTFSASAWYSPCRSCYIVTSQEECRKAFKDIMSSTKEKVQLDVYKYWMYIRKKFIDTTSSVELAELSNVSQDVLIKNLSRAIIKLL